MACDSNIEIGLSRVLYIRNDADTEWEVAGGITSLSYEGTAPTESTTNSSTQGGNAESQFTGYRSRSFTIDAQLDKRTGLNAEVGLNFAGPSRLQNLFDTGSACGKFKIANLSSGGEFEGCYTITTLGSSGDREGLIGVNASFEHKSGYTTNGVYV